MIREFSGVPDPEQGEGYYRLAVRLRTTIVVIDELPTTPDTLWLRLMALSQAYLEWEQKTEQRGLERGLERGRQQTQREVIASLLTTRFGPIEASLEALIPSLMALPIESAMPLLLQLSREELIERFSGSSDSR